MTSATATPRQKSLSLRETEFSADRKAQEHRLRQPSSVKGNVHLRFICCRNVYPHQPGTASPVDFWIQDSEFWIPFNRFAVNPTESQAHRDRLDCDVLSVNHSRMASFDLIVLGGGPAGYTAAIRAAQLELNTAIIDQREVLGGTCLNIGCIPSKALLVSSDHVRFARHQAQNHGLKFDNVSVDLERMMQRKSQVVRQLTQGLEFLMKKNKITRLRGAGQVVAPGKVALRKADEGIEEHTANHVILATGSAPMDLPNVAFDGEIVVTSEEALSFAEVPEELLVIGAGAIGLEMGSVWSRLGSKVTFVEFLPRIAAFLDPDVTRPLQKSLEAEGITFHLETVVRSVTVEKNTGIASAETKDKQALQFRANKILVAVGRKPYLEGAVAKDLGLRLTERGRIAVDQRFRTNLPGIYAIGDVIEGPMLAHKGEEDGSACAEFIAGKPAHVNYDLVPNIIYTDPEVATVGLTEETAKRSDRKVKIGKFPFVANGRALANDQSSGFVKILADARTDKLLGAQILGSSASELVSEVVSVMEFGGSAEDLGRTIHAHPTMSEAVKEAALAADNLAFSIPPNRPA
jgi:dihydrolipoamide dehydrogenase